MALVETILPYLWGQTRIQKTGSMTDEVTIGQRGICSYLCIPILPHFLRLPDYSCKHEHILNCVFLITCVTENFVRLNPSLYGGNSVPCRCFRQTGDSTLGPKTICSRPVFTTHTYTQTNTQTHTSLLNTALLSGISGSNKALKCKVSLAMFDLQIEILTFKGT